MPPDLALTTSGGVRGTGYGTACTLQVPDQLETWKPDYRAMLSITISCHDSPH